MRAAHVANYILELAKEENYKITNLKLQKLTYIFYGFHYALSDEKLFSDEIQAWKHGPVVPALYYQAMHFKSEHLDMQFFIQDENDRADDIGVIDKIIAPKIDNPELRNNLKKIWNVYKEHGAWDLRELTHLEGTPWYNTYKDGEGDKEKIEPEMIQKYYKETFVEKMKQE